MLDFIIKYWIEFLFGAAIAVLGYLYRRMASMVKKKACEQVALKAGMVAILHDRLFQQCNYYLGLGFIPLNKAEEILDNLKILYDAYHELGGNGTGTDLYQRTRALPFENVESDNV